MNQVRKDLALVPCRARTGHKISFTIQSKDIKALFADMVLKSSDGARDSPANDPRKASRFGSKVCSATTILSKVC